MKCRIGRIHFSLTVIIVIIAFVSMIANWEIYPFAPYTMYSWKHSIKEMVWQKISCLGKEATELRNEMIRPFDEARLATSLEKSHFSNDPNMAKKLTDLKSIIVQNGFDCAKVRLQFVEYSSLDDFMTGKFLVTKEYFSL